MVGRYYCIKAFCHLKTFEERLRKVLLFCSYNGAEDTLPGNFLKTPLPGQIITSIWRHEITFATVHITDDDVKFCDGPGIFIHKTAKAVY